MAMSGGAALAADRFAAAHGDHDWTGWYLGGYIGDFLDDDFTGAPDGEIMGPDSGVEVFYNAQHGNWVVSPFAVLMLPVQTATVFGTDIDVTFAANAGVRLGYALDRWLPYVFLGGFTTSVTTDGSGSWLCKNAAGVMILLIRAAGGSDEAFCGRR